MRCAAIVGAIATTASLSCRREREPPRAPPPCAIAPAPTVAGEATYYDADGTGACSFDASLDRRVAAISAADYAASAWCGACVEVAGPGGRVVVRIVDKCPACKPGGLDLSRDAFAAIAPIDNGRVPITWWPVPCDVHGPLSFHFKDGSNPFWTAIQVRNHRYAIRSLEARDRRGAWNAVPRTAYNYFVATSGLGDEPLALRVTDARGQVIEEAAVLSGDAVSRTGSAQHPICNGE